MQIKNQTQMQYKKGKMEIFNFDDKNKVQKHSKLLTTVNNMQKKGSKTLSRFKSQSHACVSGVGTKTLLIYISRQAYNLAIPSEIREQLPPFLDCELYMLVPCLKERSLAPLYLSSIIHMATKKMSVGSLGFISTSPSFSYCGAQMTASLTESDVHYSITISLLDEKFQ